ncbi:hypothetical protein [Streptomyces violascens]|uniref:Toxin-antitoxin system HicB family antitoxin n=1 Tax=Streptomyces violascens TaxID=67381 RepID=A0ABQ3R118_9ACTN|nr:hypothetical protein [Streptomyces violascens]GHI43212.1 hypothetical protein Sviol_76200 [Streptomyces violascens]
MDLTPYADRLRREPVLAAEAGDAGARAGAGRLPAPATGAPRPAPDPLDDRVTARIHFRLPERLKSRIEEAARRQGLSVNGYLVRAAAAALEPFPLEGETP